MKATKFFALLAVMMAFSFTFTACDSEATDGDVPTTEAEARSMLLGQWKAAFGISLLHAKAYDEYYRVVTPSELTIIGHVMNSWGDESDKYAPYAGQYVLHHKYPIVRINIDNTDPTKGTITYQKDGVDTALNFERLTSTSVVFTDDANLRSSKITDKTITYVNK
ncbi:MAG: hypothetical protein IJ786_03450 [Bacteroidaceae bacterium]|nr:hypothetical protein [Bacteroidaceae bacterium]